MRTGLPAGLCSLAATAVLVLGAAPAVAAARTPSPTIVSMVASSSKVKPSGVRVTVQATTSHARYCRLFYPAKLGKAMAAPVNCSTNSFRRAVLVPANNTPYVQSYKLTLKASGRGGTTYRSLVVKQVPDEPTITHRTLSPSRPTFYGGAFTISAKLHSTVRCWLTATGGIKVSSKLFRCSKSVSRVVRMPQNTSAFRRVFTVTLHARNPIAVASAGYKLVQPAAPPSFVSFGSKPSRIGTAGGRVTVTATFVRAQTCDFSAVFPHGAMGSVGACKGSFSRSYQIPANHSGTQHDYTFTLTLRGRGGKAKEEYTLFQRST